MLAGARNFFNSNEFRDGSLADVRAANYDVRYSRKRTSPAGLACPLSADFVAEVGDYYARGLPRFVDTSSYYAAFGER